MQRLLNEDSNRAIDNDPDYVYPACCKSRPLPAPPGADRHPVGSQMVPNGTIGEHFLGHQTASFLRAVADSCVLQQQFPFPQSIFSSPACQVQCLVQGVCPVGRWQRIYHDTLETQSD